MLNLRVNVAVVSNAVTSVIRTFTMLTVTLDFEAQPQSNSKIQAGDRRLSRRFIICLKLECSVFANQLETTLAHALQNLPKVIIS